MSRCCGLAFAFAVGCTQVLGVDFDEKVRVDAGLMDGGAVDAADTAPDRAWSMWGIQPESPLNLSEDGSGIAFDSDTNLYWERTSPSFDYSWEQANARCEELVLAGFDDFRLPARIELASIEKYGQPGIKLSPVMDGNPRGVWTSSADARASDRAWVVDFGLGTLATLRRTDKFESRCVRGGKSVTNNGPNARFEMALNGTVFDKVTSLTWTADVFGPFTEKEARVHCQTSLKGTLSDFRVPSLHELNTLIDERKSSPALASLFQSKGEEWVSNFVGGAAPERYTVDTNDGTARILNDMSPAVTYYTRCVR